MPKGYPLQNSFQSGEVSPRMLIRSDVEALRSSLYRMQNMIPDALGPARSRPGSLMLNYTDGYTNGRIIPFQRREDVFTVCTLLPGLIRINEGFGWEGAGENLVVNPRFDNGGDNWTVVTTQNGTVRFPPGLCILSVSNNVNSDASIRQAVSTVAGPANTHRVIIDRSIIGSESAPLVPVRIRVSSSATYDGDLLDITSTNVIASVNFEPGGNTTVYLEVTLQSEGDPVTTTLDGVSVYDTVAADIEFPAPWVDSDLQTIQYAMPPGGFVMYFVGQGFAPHKLVYDPDTGSWTFEIVVFVGAPSEWVAGNFPATLTFHQGRSWWGGAPKQPETFYASKSGAYEDLTPGSQDDDGIVFTVSQRGEIRWMLGVRNLLVGTENGEHVIDSETGIITPGDIKVEQQSAYGSAPHQPLKLGNDAIYVSPDRRKMRKIGYEWEASAWTSRDITFMAQHLGSELFRRPIWAQNPDTLLGAPTLSGKPVFCTFENREGIVGFFPCPQWGSVIDMCVVETRQRSRIFVLRYAQMEDGTDRLFYETWLDAVTIQTDTSIAISVPAPTQVFTGFEALAGEFCDVITDGAVHPPMYISPTGEISTQWPATDVVVGKQFTPLLETMPVSDLSQEGSVIKFYKRRNAIFVRVLDSSIPYINGQQPANRSPATPMDTREPDKTADYYVTNLGHDRFSMVEVTQPDPVPLTVLGIFGDQGAETL